MIWYQELTSGKITEPDPFPCLPSICPLKVWPPSLRPQLSFVFWLIMSIVRSGTLSFFLSLPGLLPLYNYKSKGVIWHFRPINVGYPYGMRSLKIRWAKRGIYLLYSFVNLGEEIGDSFTHMPQTRVLLIDRAQTKARSPFHVGCHFSPSIS